MLPAIEEKRPEIDELCARYRVRRLELFGSAARDDFVPEQSDIDFLVEFHAYETGDRFARYFGLMRDLEALFDRPVDLIETGTIENPYFLKAIKPTRLVLYEAA